MGIVSHVKVLSDKVEDVSSPEAWKKSYITAGMSDQEKVLAIWRTVVKYRHQIDPPDEYLQENAHDVFKTIHVYGYGQCCCASSHVETLARYLGLEARGWAITAHSVPEVKYDNSWHTVNGSLMNYFLNPDGKIASVAGIEQAVLEWHAQHPGYRGNDGKLRQFAANGGWQERARPAGVNRGAVLGRQRHQHGRLARLALDHAGVRLQGVPLRLRRIDGLRIERAVANRRAADAELVQPWAARQPVGRRRRPSAGERRGTLGMCRKFGDVAGRIGNGTLEYDVPLASGEFRYGTLSAGTCATRAEDASSPAAVHVQDPARPGVLVLDMPCSYVYLSGRVKLQPVVGPGESIVVGFSDNHGLDWNEIARVTDSGPQRLDLKRQCYRRYDYRLKFQFLGKGTGLDALAIYHDIQHSQALAGLTAGREQDQLLGRAVRGKHYARRRYVRPLPQQGAESVLQGVPSGHDRQHADGRHSAQPQGAITFPIATPGEIHAAAHERLLAGP